MAKNKKNKSEQTVTESAKEKKSLKDRLFTTSEDAARRANDTALQAAEKAAEKAKPDNLKIDEDKKFGEGARQMKENVEQWNEDVAREKKEFEDSINKEPGADTLTKSGDELKDQINQQVGAVEGQVNTPAKAYEESNPATIEDETINQEELPVNEPEVPVGERPKALTPEQQYEKAKEDAANHNNNVNRNNNAVEESADIDSDFYKKYVDQYYGPQNGADYLKSLWSQGAGGKAAAIGNVLGNLMGAAGKGALGQDYETDWQKYKDNYIQAQAERNKRAFEDNMDIVKQIRQNDVVRNELSKTMEKMKELGKITPQEFEAIKKGMAATGKSSQTDYYLASILGNLASDKEFTTALKEMGEEGMKLLSGITGFAGNTIGGINRFFGGGR